MHASLAGKLVLPSLLAFALAGNAQQPSSSVATAEQTESAKSARRNATKPTIVLVHGAFADATGWQEVIPLLQQEGYTVIAVQNPLTSLETDIATTKRVIDAQAGPVVAVGHSYGGVVITGAAAGDAKVKALVYVAAFGPDAGEAIGPLLEKYPSLIGKALVPDAAGFLYIDLAKYREVFAGDLPVRRTNAMAVAQKPIFGPIFGQTVSNAAWKTIPSWYMVAQQDNAINPELQRFFAKRMGARTTEVKASHLPFISRASDVAKMIREAAEASSQ